MQNVESHIDKVAAIGSVEANLTQVIGELPEGTHSIGGATFERNCL